MITIFSCFSLMLAISLDAFASSFAYGTSKIKIPLISLIIISFISTSLFLCSLLGAHLLAFIIDPFIGTILAISIFYLLGLFKIFDSVIKNWIKKQNKPENKIQFQFFNIKFILNIYATPENADVDKSRTLSPIEAITLGLALSIDGMLLGLGSQIIHLNWIYITVFSLFFNSLFLFLGQIIGAKIAQKTPLNLSWVGGVILIIIASLKFI